MTKVKKKFLKMTHGGENTCIIWDWSPCKSFTVSIRKIYTSGEK